MSFLLGFSFPAAVMALVIGFIWLLIKLDASRIDVVIGAASFMALLVFGFLAIIRTSS